MRHTENKRLPWQHLIKIVFDKICKITAKGVKLKSESFFSISCGVLKLWRKTIRGGGFPPVRTGLKGQFCFLTLERKKILTNGKKLSSWFSMHFHFGQ